MPVIAANPLATQSSSIVAPAASMFAITPSDTDEVVTVVRAIFVGVAGDVSVIDTANNTVVHKNCAAGSYIGPFRVKQVKATGTTATNLVGYV